MVPLSGAGQHIEIVPEYKWASYTLVEKSRLNHTVCETPFHQILINFDGNISCCCQDASYSLLIGRLSMEDELSFTDIMNGEKLFNIRETILSGNLKKLPICMFCETGSLVDLSSHVNELRQYL